MRDVLHESLNLKYYHVHNGVQALHDWVKDRLASEGAPAPIDLSPKLKDDGSYGEHF